MLDFYSTICRSSLLNRIQPDGWKSETECRDKIHRNPSINPPSPASHPGTELCQLLPHWSCLLDVELAASDFINFSLLWWLLFILKRIEQRFFVVVVFLQRTAENSRILDFLKYHYTT